MDVKSLHFLLFLLASVVSAAPKNILLTNDDGWAVAIIRAQMDSLEAAGFSVSGLPSSYDSGEPLNDISPQVVLSAPAENESGTGSSTRTPTTLTEECEFDTCPAGSPATGNNASDSEFE